MKVDTISIFIEAHHRDLVYVFKNCITLILDILIFFMPLGGFKCSFRYFLI